MLHLLHAKINRCLFMMIVMTLLAMGSAYGWQTISLAGSLANENFGANNSAADQTVKHPFYITYEHAMIDYQLYNRNEMSGDCIVNDKAFDFAVTPVFEYLNVKGNSREVMQYGALLRAQFNWNNVWLRAYDFVGQVAEHQYSRSRKSAGADDVVIKLGYDVLKNNDQHLGLYLLTSLPTNRNLMTKVVDDMNFIDVELMVQSPVLGSKNFNVGIGLNGGCPLYKSDSFETAVLFDAQYAYAIPTTYGHLAVSKFMANGVWHLSPSTIYGDGFVNSDARLTFTPGHSLINWFAFHCAFENTSLEVGSECRMDFGSKASLKLDNDTTEFKDALHLFAPSVALNIKPYLAVSHLFDSRTISTELGLGVAYDYNELLKNLRLISDVKPDVFQGFNIWATVSVNF